MHLTFYLMFDYRFETVCDCGDCALTIIVIIYLNRTLSNAILGTERQQMHVLNVGEGGGKTHLAMLWGGTRLLYSIPYRARNSHILRRSFFMCVCIPRMLPGE